MVELSRASSFVHHSPAVEGRDPHAVAVVVHGLNLKPAGMQPIINQLMGMGLEVVSCRLCGHGDNFDRKPGMTADQARMESFRTVSDELWREEFCAAYAYARARSAALQDAPLYFVGYSLGGLLGCETMLVDDEVTFDRLVLFAPALRIPIYGYLFLPLAPFSSLTIPSFSPARHRANRSTPVAGYTALYKMTASLARRPLTPALNVPTLLFIDRGDELVSASKVAALVDAQRLTQWDIRFVEKDETARERFRHLIIDEESVGSETWAAMMAAMRDHFAANPRHA